MKQCKECHREFEPTSRTQRYCCIGCAQRVERRRHRRWNRKAYNQTPRNTSEDIPLWKLNEALKQS